jgi:serine phosphatase RsbU (regulator of sigma subunit)
MLHFRGKLFVALIALALSVSGAATFFLYGLSRRYLVREIESKAKSIAATSASLLDGDLHERLANGTATPEEALEFRRQLDDVRERNRRSDVHVFFVYTAVRRPDGTLHAVVEDERDEEAGYRGNLAESDRINVGHTGVEALKEDQYGKWLTGYAPIRDSRGQTAGTLLVDVEASDLYGRLHLLLAGGLAALALALAIAIGISLPLARLVTRPLDALVQAVDRIGSGDLDARAEVPSRDEFARLADAINTMLPKLRDHLRLLHSVQIAQEVQRNLLPSTFPRVASFEIAARSVYCDEIGGDYYDVVDLSSDDEPRLGVIVADVAGHGVAAALLMATTRAILRSRLSPGDSLADVLGDANRSIVSDRFSDRFVTLFAAVVDTRDLRLRWACAGHEPAVLYDPATDSFEELGGQDIPLGIRSDWTYREHSREGWRHGQVILIGTDGIWETRDASGTAFGREALRDLIRENASRPPAAILEAVLGALARFRGGQTQADDVTLVVLKA